MKIASQFFFLCLIIGLLSSCHHDTSLPSVVLASNENLFACKINGQAWVAKPGLGEHPLNISIFTVHKADIGYTLDTNAPKFKSLTVFAIRGYESIRLGASQFKGLGTYSLSYSLPCYMPQCNMPDREQGEAQIYLASDKQYYSRSDLAGQLTISHYDTTVYGYEIAGTFSCKVRNLSSQEEINMTEGRFYYKGSNTE